MLSADQDTAISPVVGAILMVAVTVVLSATVGLFVMDLQPTGPGDTQSAVSISEQADGIHVTAIHVAQNLTIRTDGRDTYTLTPNDTGTEVVLPVTAGTQVTVVSASDSGKATVLTSQTATANHTGLLVHYTFDNLSGRTLTDESDYHHTAVTTNVTTTDGMVGQAGVFNGSAYANATVATGLTGDTSYTVAFWMKYTATDKRQWIADYGRYNGTNEKAIHWLIKASNTTQFGMWSGVQNRFDISAYEQRWVHVATTYNASSDTLTTYLNGSRVDSDTGTLNLTSDKLLLGHQRDGGNQHKFHGKLDEFRIYNTVLNASEVNDIYTTEAP